MILRIGNAFDRGSRFPLRRAGKVRGRKIEYLPSAFSLQPSASRSFTLVEMLVVLAVIAMIMGISIPFVASFGKGLRLKTSARGISGAMRVAKSNAITYRDEYSVVFDIENSSYWIEGPDSEIVDKKNKLSTSVGFRVPEDEEADPITFEDDRVIFLPNGSLQGHSGSVIISDKRGDSKAISVIGSTGKIKID